MVITFCGHAEIDNGKEELQERVLRTIDEIAKGGAVTFYLGGYGSFDGIALQCAARYKEKHPDSKLLFVSPYLNEKYFKNREFYLQKCDEIILAEVEKYPPKYAILKRNEWMIRRADHVIAYVNHSWGGAAKTLLFAVRRKKPYTNLGSKAFH